VVNVYIILQQIYSETVYQLTLESPKFYRRFVGNILFSFVWTQCSLICIFTLINYNYQAAACCAFVWDPDLRAAAVVESLDELADIVVPLFADVDNKNVEVPEWLDHPFGPEQVKVCVNKHKYFSEPALPGLVSSIWHLLSGTCSSEQYSEVVLLQFLSPSLELAYLTGRIMLDCSDLCCRHLVMW